MKNHIILMSRYGDNKIGARIIGVELREIALEILNSEPNIKIIFDFDGIDYISSGFAKELFGELFNRLGNEFNRRVSIKIPPENAVIKNIIIKVLKITNER